VPLDCAVSLISCSRDFRRPCFKDEQVWEHTQFLLYQSPHHLPHPLLSNDGISRSVNGVVVEEVNTIKCWRNLWFLAQKGLGLWGGHRGSLKGEVAERRVVSLAKAQLAQLISRIARGSMSCTSQRRSRSAKIRKHSCLSSTNRHAILVVHWLRGWHAKRAPNV
jgi:hypothetical protein